MTKCTLSNLRLWTRWGVFYRQAAGALCNLSVSSECARHIVASGGRTVAQLLALCESAMEVPLLGVPEPLIRIISTLSRPPTAAAAPQQIL